MEGSRLKEPWVGGWPLRDRASSIAGLGCWELSSILATTGRSCARPEDFCLRVGRSDQSFADSSTDLLFIVLVAIIPPRGYIIRESGPQRPTKQSRHVCDRLCEEKQRCVPYERRHTTDPQSSNFRRNDGISVDFRFPPSHLSSLSSRVVSTSDCAVRGLRFESHR